MLKLLSGLVILMQLAIILMGLALPAFADAPPPVRLSIVPSGGSGIEQDIVDNISSQFSDDPTVAISTVNPDWYVLCNIHESNDQVSGQIRYNGTVTIKTRDGQVVSTVAVQKYNQDFSLQPGAPLNKKLVDSAAREVINAISERAVGKIRDAVNIEESAREQIIRAETLASDDKYAEAIDVLAALGPDTVHFDAAKKRIAQFQMEKRALELVSAAQTKAKAGSYREAIALLKDVDLQSKRHKEAIQLGQRYKALLANHSKRKQQAITATPQATKSTTKPISNSTTESEKQALQKKSAAN